MDSDDAQSQLIGSLRTQIQDLFSQVTQLNNKLVKSYDRVSDLEDDLHVASSSLRASSLKISQLELERTQHLSALNTGLLVEKSHVTAELTRLMEKATEEAAQRGQAESARIAIEKELDDLSASLFDQANTMVAEARYAQSVSEQKLVEVQSALRCAEDTVTDMEKEVKTVKQEKERWERNKYWENPSSKRICFLASHTPYQEFLLFVAHLRSVHPSSANPPAMSTLLPLPFLARLVTEDSDPTIRLDLAPSLNWLSRRSVMAAIYNNQLLIESVSAAYFLQEASVANSTVVSSANGFICALCGYPIFSSSSPLGDSSASSWSSTIFKRPSITSPTPSQTKVPPLLEEDQPHQIHIFRLSSPQTPSAVPVATISSTFSSLTSPVSGSTSPPPLTRHSQRHLSVSSTSSALSTASVTTTTIYPLCTSGWCLERLKHTVDLWGFVRRDVVGRVWEEEVPVVIPPPSPPGSRGHTVNGSGGSGSGSGNTPPPIPPRKRGLWGAFSERAQAAAAAWGSPDKKGPNVPAKDKPATVPPPIPKRSEGRRGTKEEKDVFLAPLNEKDSPNAEPKAPVENNSPGTVPTSESESAAPDGSPATAPTSSSEPTAPDGSPTTAPTSSSEPTAPDGSPTTAPTSSSEPTAPVGSPTTTTAPASSPTSTPLPPSRPLTPNGVPTPPARSRPVSMGGGVPPPIPRRAAARGAVVGGERPASPVPAVGSKLREEAEVKEESKEEEKVEVKEETNEEGKAEEEAKEEVKKDEEVPVKEEAAVEEIKTTEEAKEDVKMPDEGKEDVKTEVEKSEEEVKTVEPSTPPLVNGHNDNPSPTDSNASTTPLVNGITANHVDSPDTPTENGETEEKDDRVWIGDATWEERTWKDLMKIKEEMFWARVGGFRDR